MTETCETKKQNNFNNFFLAGGVLLLLLSFALLYSWLTLFFTTAISPAGGACWGTGCVEAEWQDELSRSLGFYFHSSNTSIKPFLIVFHISLLIFIIRSGRGKNRTLPFEFTLLNIFWMVASTIVFMLIYFCFKAAVPQTQYPIIVPLATAVSETKGIPNPNSDDVVGNPYLVITGPAAPPSYGCVIADKTGWSVFDPKDKRCIIGSKMPNWVYGKPLAWAGLLASIMLVLGLSLSQATGWLNRLILRWPKKDQIGIMLLAIGITVAGILVEFHIFGFDLFL